MGAPVKGRLMNRNQPMAPERWLAETILAIADAGGSETFGLSTVWRRGWNAIQSSEVQHGTHESSAHKLSRLAGIMPQNSA